jgi:hypothetical protein
MRYHPPTPYQKTQHRPTDTTRKADRPSNANPLDAPEGRANRSARLGDTALDRRAVSPNELKTDPRVVGREESRRRKADRTTRVECATSRTPVSRIDRNPVTAFGSKSRGEPSRRRRNEPDRSENRPRPRTRATARPGANRGRRLGATEIRRWETENWK